MTWHFGIDEFHSKELILNHFQERLNLFHAKLNWDLLHVYPFYHALGIEHRACCRIEQVPDAQLLLKGW